MYLTTFGYKTFAVERCMILPAAAPKSHTLLVQADMILDNGVFNQEHTVALNIEGDLDVVFVMTGMETLRLPLSKMEITTVGSWLCVNYVNPDTTPGSLYARAIILNGEKI